VNAAENSVSVMFMSKLCHTGSGVEKPIGEVVLQIDVTLRKERKLNVRGGTQVFKLNLRCFAALNEALVVASYLQKLRNYSIYLQSTCTCSVGQW